MNPDLVDDHIDDELDTDFSAPARSRVSVRTRPLGDARHPGAIARARRVYRRRRFKAAIGLVLAVVVIWTGVSLGGALLNPAFGSSFASRFSEWAREHGGASIVNWVENEWYSHHPPPSAESPRRGDRAPTVGGPGRPRVRPICRLQHRSCPSPVRPSPVRASGRRSAGGSGASRRSTRPPCVPTPCTRATWSGVAWMDTKLLTGDAVLGQPDSRRRALHRHGSGQPGGGRHAGRRLQRRLPDVRRQRRLLHRRQGGPPAANGAASFVIYRNGTATSSRGAATSP